MERTENSRENLSTFLTKKGCLSDSFGIFRAKTGPWKISKSESRKNLGFFINKAWRERISGEYLYESATHWNYIVKQNHSLAHLKENFLIDYSAIRRQKELPDLPDIAALRDGGYLSPDLEREYYRMKFFLDVHQNIVKEAKDEGYPDLRYAPNTSQHEGPGAYRIVVPAGSSPKSFIGELAGRKNSLTTQDREQINSLYQTLQDGRLLKELSRAQGLTVGMGKDGIFVLLKELSSAQNAEKYFRSLSGDSRDRLIDVLDEERFNARIDTLESLTSLSCKTIREDYARTKSRLTIDPISYLETVSAMYKTRDMTNDLSERVKSMENRLEEKESCFTGLKKTAKRVGLGAILLPLRYT